MKIGSAEWRALIIEGAETMHVRLGDRQTAQMASHATELLRWNRRINLTRITDPIEMAIRHFLDSIAASPLIPGHARVLDVGAGGGFPGIPLKLLRPSLRVTLIEASRKKTHFLKHIARTLGLDHTEALHCRAEEMAHETGYRAGFDVVVSRALTSVARMAELASPLLTPGGIALVWKTAEQAAQPETGAAGRTSPALEYSTEVVEYTLPRLNLKRAIVVMRF